MKTYTLSLPVNSYLFVFESTQIILIYGLSGGIVIKQIIEGANNLAWSIDNDRRTATFTSKDGSNIRMMIIGNN